MLPLVGESVTLGIVLVVGARAAGRIGNARELLLQASDAGRGHAAQRGERGADAWTTGSHACMPTTPPRCAAMRW